MKKVRMALLMLLLFMSTINYYQVANLFDLDNQNLDEEKQLNNRKIPILASNSTVIAERIRNHNQATELHWQGEQNLENPNNNKTMYSGIRLPSYKITTRGPIDIDNDTAFGVSGYNFNGSGTESDPYIIEEYNITDSTTNLIDIRNTTSHFIIRNSWLDGVTGTVGNNGIYFENVTNGVIRNNTIHSCWFGMWIDSSNDTIILENKIYNNSASGITLRMSTIDTTVSRNKIYNSSNNAIYVYYANFTILSNNDLFNNSGSGIEIQESFHNYVSGNNISYNNGNFLYSSDNNTIINNTIVGNSYTGILADSGADDNIVKNNNFFGNNGSGIQAWDDGSNNNFTYNYWDDHSGTDSNGDGFFDAVYSLVGSAGNTDPYPLVHPYYGYITRDTIYIDDNTDFATLGFPGAGTFNNPYLIEGYNITDSTTNLIDVLNTDVYFIIRDNVLDGVTASYRGIRLQNARNGIVERNIIHSTVRGILLQGSLCYNNTFFNNQIYNISLYGIVVSSSSHDNVISGNIVYNCSDYGILQDGISGNTTIANNIVFNITYTGIKIGGYSDNNTVANNTVFNTAETSPNAGIFFDWSDNNTISNNTIYNNSDSGLIILNSNNNNITSNTLINNTQYGIRIWVAGNNYISRNVLTDNIQYGIYVDSSSTGNTLEWNNFFGNKLSSTQASDAGSSNTFIYNYWDDHTGPDTTPFDGYIDNPYNIDGGGNTDPFPRAYPLFPHAPININDNADFTTVGFPGQGTINDPYVIEEYFIINSTTTLIYIQDTTAYFIIRYNNLNSINMSYIGIQLQNVTNGYIHNNSIQNSTRGIKLAMSENNSLTYNNIFNCGRWGILESGGITIQEGSDYNIVKGNEIYNCTDLETYAIYLDSSDHNLIENNQIYNDYSGIKLYLSDFNNVSYNTIDEIFGTTNSIGLWGQLSNNNTFSYNIITDNNYEPSYFLDSDYNIIEGNIIANNSRSGIDLHSNSIGNQIRNNTIYNQVQQAAVRLRDYSANNLITNNLFYQNKWGIWCGFGGGQGGCNNNDIINNTIIDNTDYGIQMEKASYNLIENNTISNNALAGIYFVSSSGYNTIYSNNILNNIGGQAIDDNGTNEFQKNGWGNYWGSAYSGLDENYDGIGDTPHAFSGNQDPFPVTNPIDWYFQFNFTSIQGDWNVIASETHQNEYITLTGNLLISSTGILNFTNVILRMNCSVNGQYRVEVANGGFFQTNTNSTITPFNKSHVWYFKANGGSSITLHDSKFVFAGWEMGTNGDHSGMWVNANNAYIRNCIFQHNYHGLFLYQRNRHVISQNNFSSNTLYGLYVQTSSNNEISGNAFSNNEIAMYMISDSDNNTLSGNIVIFNLGHGFYIDGNTNNNTIFNNSISANGDESIHAGIALRNCHNNSVIKNYVINNNHHGIRLTNTDNNTITNNSVYGNGENGFLISESENNTITENIIHDNSNGFALEGTYINQIYNNSIYSNSNGIIILRSNNDMIYNNSISNNGYGIQLQYSYTKIISHNITIESNSFNSNSVAIRMVNVSDCNVLDNEFILCLGYSIYLEDNSSKNTFTGNVIKNSSNYGIYLDSTTSNNNISLNEFYFNKLGNNQAYDDGSLNSFTFNFWNEWITPDNNADGIVDIAYVIDGTATNTDDYPRVYPYVTHNPIYIDEDADFNTLNFPGQGIPSDPYIIENYYITSSSSNLIYISGTTVYFNIRNCFLNGLYGGFDGIYLTSVTNGIIENNFIRTCSMGVYLWGSGSNNLSFNKIFNNSNSGLYISASSNNHFSNNSIAKNNHGMRITNSANDNVISNNSFYNNTQFGIQIWGDSHRMNISDNKIEFNGWSGVSFETNNTILTRNFIYNNGFIQPSSAGIYISYSSGKNTISQNTLFNNLDNGIYLASSSKNNTLYDNTINNSNRGIYVDNWATENNISHNRIFNSTYYGIYMYSNSNDNIIEKNIIFNNGDYGIWLESCSSNNFSGNEIFYNSNTGIYLTSSSNNNDFYGNLIYNNTNYGIRLESLSSNNNITSNYIANNGDYGIYLASTTGDNNISWNIFIDNNGGTSQAYDDGSDNTFSYNYWDDHTGPDANFDGIIDSPYIFTDNNDSYPLTKPYASHEPIFINNNANFTTLGFPGDGSPNNPYIIENYYIINPSTILIRIEGTTAHFIIRNNFLIGLTGISDGIYLFNVRNGTILDNIIHSAKNAIYLESSINNTLSGNSIYNNSFHSIYLLSSTDNIVSYNNVLNNSRNGIVVTYSDNNVLSNNTVANNSQYGIVLFEAHDNSVINNTIYNNTLDGIILTNSTTRTTLVNNKVYDNSRYGIFLVYSSTDNNISYNNVYGNSQTGLVLWLFCTSNTLSYNNVYNNSYSGIGLVNSSNNNVISTNYVFNNSWDGIGLINSSNNNNITNNEIHHNLWNGIFMNASSSHNTLSDNTLYNNSENGILLESSAFNNTVVSNSIYNNSLDGIAIDGVHNNTLLNNVIQDHYTGISLTNSLNTTCSYNSIYKSSADSIRLQYANYTTIIGNNVSNNAVDGMLLMFSYHNIIINNTISNNNHIGMYIAYSSFNLVMTNLISNHLNDTFYGIGIMVTSCINNTISNNTISDNVNFGIMLGPNSANNTIKWNDFLNNNPNNTMGLGSSQAYDNGTANLFTYNYWSEWTSPDSEPDGIVDVPYIINGSAGNSDPYPLAFTAIHDLSIPTVRYPNDGGVFGGVIDLQWDPAIDSWNHSVTYTLFYSSDGGGMWTLIDSDWTNTNYTWDTTSPLVPNGTKYLIQVKATCSTGLWQVDTSDFVFTINNVLADSTPPEITDFPSNYSYVELTVGHNLTWVATDQFPDTYTIWRNNTPIPNYINVDWLKNTPITINIDNLSPGLYIYKIEFVDTSGNPSTHEVWVTVTENAPPIVTITEPEQDEILDGTIAIAWTAIDPEGQPMTYSVDYWNGNSWINLAPSLSSTSTTWDTTNVIDRPDYKIRVNASDGYKFGVNESGSFTIDNIESFAQIPAGFTKFEVTDTITVGLDVSNSVNVTINRLSDSDVPDPPSDLESLNIYLNITISDEDALNDLWINISFNELNGRDPNNVKIYYYNEDDERWVEAKETGVDLDNEVVWAWTDHLTLFGVMDEQTQPADNWLTLLVMAVFLITPVIVVTVFIYRRAKRKMRMKKAQTEIRQSQIDLGILTRDLDQD